MRVMASGLLLLWAAASAARAEVVRVEVTSRTAVAGGQSFGLAGPYERLAGRIHFEVDPAAPANVIVADIEYAPRNAAGRVEFWSDFYLLKPQRAEAGNGAALVDVMNRGRKRTLYYFNDAPGRGEPVSAADMGDGFLLRQGFTLLWLGWQFDVPPVAELMRVTVPTATEGDRPIEGLVRSDFVVAERTYDHSLGDRGHAAYAVADPEDPRNVMTVRDSATGPRRVVAREEWQFGRLEDGRSVADPTRVLLTSGFEPNLIYEVVYVAKDPPVAGLGFAALRDAATYLKQPTDLTLGLTPGAIERVIAFGDSQTGRALRTFIYDGFNANEAGGRAFDGIMAHLGASARGSFNHRFAQPSRAVDRNYYYPNDLFPFSDTVQTDPLTGREDGLLSRLTPATIPKVFYTNSSTEYWRLPTALIHTNVEGSRDVPPTEHARIFLFAGTQHVPSALPSVRAEGLRIGNPNDYRWFLRALLLHLNRWLAHDLAPPPSRYPQLADRTLVELADLRFPPIPGVRPPAEVARGYRLDHGPLFATQGVITLEPPEVQSILPFLVPQVDEDGNELAGLRSPTLTVPLATYTGWSPFSAISTAGAYVPFLRTRAERESSNDFRDAIEERYLNRAHYLGLVATAALELIGQGYLLEEDLPSILRESGRYWDLFVQYP